MCYSYTERLMGEEARHRREKEDRKRREEEARRVEKERAKREWMLVRA